MRMSRPPMSCAYSTSYCSGHGQAACGQPVISCKHVPQALHGSQRPHRGLLTASFTIFWHEFTTVRSPATAKPLHPACCISCTTSCSLLDEREVTHTQVSSAPFPAFCDANASATALPMPDELPERHRASYSVWSFAHKFQQTGVCKVVRYLLPALCGPANPDTAHIARGLELSCPSPACLPDHRAGLRAADTHVVNRALHCAQPENDWNSSLYAGVAVEMDSF